MTMEPIETLTTAALKCYVTLRLNHESLPRLLAMRLWEWNDSDQDIFTAQKSDMVSSFPGYGAQTTIGNAVFNETGVAMTASRLEHETKHVDQWAILGPVGFGLAYLAAFGVQGQCNIFEWWADFSKGGYTQC